LIKFVSRWFDWARGGEAGGRVCFLGASLLLSTGCEAEFDLSDIEARSQASVRNSDHYHAAARRNDLVVVVGDSGVVLTSNTLGEDWRRTRVRQNKAVPFPDFIDVAACPNGKFVALDANKGVWFSNQSATKWERAGAELSEEGFDLTCDPSSRVWVVGSFMLITSSDDQGESWADHSIGEDAIFTAVQFVDQQLGIAVGEFGLHYRTFDGGRSWAAQTPIPSDFYPLSATFESLQEGWLGGLQGAILRTVDGGASWTKQATGVRAPIYGLASEGGYVLAVGGRGTRLHLVDGQWRRDESRDNAKGYLRAVLTLGGGRFLAAGGGGGMVVLTHSAAGPVG
jgi:photosystem II stability/assembly factor-like uncharacterized protein